MNIDQLYILIRKFEGCRLMPYYDCVGVLTCGWGSTGLDVFPGKQWTQEYADRRMEMDAARFAKAALLLCPAIEADGLNAIADFAYNLGIGRLKQSTLRRKLNAGDIEGAKLELAKWNKGGGRVLPGLVARRAVEAALLGQS